MRELIEFVELLYIGIANSIYNFFLFISQSVLFGSRGWWWQFHFHLWKEFFLSRITHIVHNESKDMEYDQENFIYGETPCITIKTMLDHLEIKKGELFVDLGCGRGNALFYAHFLYEMKGAGYDLLPSFIRKARKIADTLKIKNIKFFEKDILDADLKKAKVVYVAGTTFSSSFIKKLNRKLTQVPENAYIITLSYYLPDQYFNLFREQELDFSWGKSHVYYHRRRNKKTQSVVTEEEIPDNIKKNGEMEDD